MTWRIRWAMRLYPRKWRERYGSEFEALLEQTGLNGRDFYNVLKGAAGMQLRSIGFTKMAAALSLLGLLAAGLSSFAMPKKYVSSAVVNVGDPAAYASTGYVEALNRVTNETLSRTNLYAIIRDQGLYSEQRNHSPVEDIVAQMRRSISVRVVGAPPEKYPHMGFVMIQFAYSDPKSAANVTGAIISKLMAAMRVTGSAGHVVEVIDPPSHPTQMSSPKIPLVLLIGLLGGLTVATLLFGVLKLTNSRQTV